VTRIAQLSRETDHIKQNETIEKHPNGDYWSWIDFMTHRETLLHYYGKLEHVKRDIWSRFRGFWWCVRMVHFHVCLEPDYDWITSHRYARNKDVLCTHSIQRYLICPSVKKLLGIFRDIQHHLYKMRWRTQSSYFSVYITGNQWIYERGNIGFTIQLFAWLSVNKMWLLHSIEELYTASVSQETKSGASPNNSLRRSFRVIRRFDFSRHITNEKEKNDN
jgi:hypothetical protein